MSENTPHAIAMRELRGAFEAFIRTGHWGTCVECPVVDGRKLPELCRCRERYDHQLLPLELFAAYEDSVSRSRRHATVAHQSAE